MFVKAWVCHGWAMTENCVQVSGRVVVYGVSAWVVTRGQDVCGTVRHRFRRSIMHFWCVHWGQGVPVTSPSVYGHQGLTRTVYVCTSWVWVYAEFEVRITLVEVCFRC